MTLNRNQVAPYRSFGDPDDGVYMIGTAEECLLEVWGLTRQA